MLAPEILLPSGSATNTHPPSSNALLAEDGREGLRPHTRNTQAIKSPKPLPRREDEDAAGRCPSLQQTAWNSTTAQITKFAHGVSVALRHRCGNLTAARPDFGTPGDRHRWKEEAARAPSSSSSAVSTAVNAAARSGLLGAAPSTPSRDSVRQVSSAARRGRL